MRRAWRGGEGPPHVPPLRPPPRSLTVSVAALLLLSLWGIPIAVVVLVLLVAYVAAAHRRDSGGRIEREKPIEPTGRTRKGSGGAMPANERGGA